MNQSHQITFDFLYNIIQQSRWCGLRSVSDFFYIFTFGMYLMFNILLKQTLSGLVTERQIKLFQQSREADRQKCVEEQFIAEQIFDCRDFMFAEDGPKKKIKSKSETAENMNLISSIIDTNK